MRSITIICSLFFLISCSTDKKYENPNWLKGKWMRVHEEKNKKTYEFWKDNFKGIGFTLQEKDTVFVENMRIFNSEGKGYLQVIGLDQKPTFFEFTKQTETSFTAENSANQFPKKIKYAIEKDTLKAIISNDDFSVDFNFIKLN